MIDLVFRNQELSYKVSIEAGGWEVIKKYVHLGLGISIVSGVCLTGDQSLYQFPLGKYFPERSYGIVLKRDQLLSPQAKLFVDCMDPELLKKEQQK